MRRKVVLVIFGNRSIPVSTPAWKSCIGRVQVASLTKASLLNIHPVSSTWSIDMKIHKPESNLRGDTKDCSGENSSDLLCDPKAPNVPIACGACKQIL